MNKVIPFPQPAPNRLKGDMPTLDKDDALFLISTDDTSIGDIRVDLYAMHSSDGWQLMAVCPTGSDLSIQSVLSHDQLRELEQWANRNIAAPEYSRRRYNDYA